MEVLKDILDVMAKLIGLPTAVLGVFSAALGVYTYFRDSGRKLCSETMAEYGRLQKEVFDQLNDWTGPDQVAEAADSPGSHGHTEINNALAKIEHFCVGLNRGVYDFETFYQLSHGYFDYKLQWLLEPLIDKKLNAHGAKEDYYNNLHKVWKRMAERSKREL